MNWYLIILLVALLPFNAARGQEDSPLPTESDSVSHEDQSDRTSWLTQGNTKIWLDKDVSLGNQTIVILFRAQNATETMLAEDVLEHLTSTIQGRLEEAGITVIQPGQRPFADSINVKPIITKYVPGSVSGRWLSPGLGATTCIIRATIFHALTEEVIGEAISWKQVSSGGLFSARADKYVPEEAAAAIADALAKQARK